MRAFAETCCLRPQSREDGFFIKPADFVLRPKAQGISPNESGLFLI